MSSAITCQENEHTHGMLQSLGLDNLTIQALGFSILVLWFAKRIFYPKRKDSGIERALPLKKFDTQPSEAAVIERTPGELNFLMLLIYFTWFVLYYYNYPV